MNTQRQLIKSTIYSRQLLFNAIITIIFALSLPQYAKGESICCKANCETKETLLKDQYPSHLLGITLVNSLTAEATLNHHQQCGINPRIFGRLFKSFGKSAGRAAKNANKSGGFFKNIIKWFKEIKWPWKKAIASSELLLKDVQKIHASNEVLPNIEKYLSETKPNEEGLKLIRDFKADASKAETYLAGTNPGEEDGVKVIRCLKTDSGEVKLTLQEGNSTKINKTIHFSGTFDVSHYDIKAMKERFYYVGNVEYVEFIIPKKAQYVLDGMYSQRVYECMIFNLPKDAEGKWIKVKALIIDIFTRPRTLWSEARFRQELKMLNVDSRTVKEIEQYMFVHNRNNNKKDSIYEFFDEEVA